MIQHGVLFIYLLLMYTESVFNSLYWELSNPGQNQLVANFLSRSVLPRGEKPLIFYTFGISLNSNFDMYYWNTFYSRILIALKGPLLSSNFLPVSCLKFSFVFWFHSCVTIFQVLPSFSSTYISFPQWSFYMLEMRKKESLYINFAMISRIL